MSNNKYKTRILAGETFLNNCYSQFYMRETEEESRRKARGFKELKEHIEKNGMIHPLICYYGDTKHPFLVHIGMRRLVILRDLKYEKAKIILMDSPKIIAEGKKIPDYDCKNLIYHSIFEGLFPIRTEKELFKFHGMESDLYFPAKDWKKLPDGLVFIRNHIISYGLESNLNFKKK